MRPSSSTILLTSTLLLPSHAQNTTNTPQNTTTCSPNYHPNLSTSPVNSTGTLKWTWDILFSSNSYTLPWFYSVLLNATTPRNAGPPITVSTYISVPDNLPNGTRICAYQFGSINATLEDPQSGTHSWSHYQSPTNTSCPTTHLPNIDLPDGYISLNAPSQLTPFEDFTFEESVSLEQ
ncbi:hypothetical protein GRF29_154g379455, partial [Pseudopithomyces chartarum]